MLTKIEIAELIKKIENNTVTITELLDKVAQAQLGENIRAAIYGAILICYKDGKAGAIDLTARAQLAEAIAGLTIDSEIIDVRTAVDGTTYATAGEAVRKQIGAISREVENISDRYIYSESPQSYGYDKGVKTKFHIGMPLPSDGTIDTNTLTRAYSNLISIDNLDSAMLHFRGSYDTYKLGVAQYRADGSHIGNIGYVDTDRVLSDIPGFNPSTTFIRVIVATNKNTNVTDEELEMFSENTLLYHGEYKLDAHKLYLNGQQPNSAYSIKTTGVNNRNRRPIIIFDNNGARLNTDEIASVGLMTGTGRYSINLQTANLNTDYLTKDDNTLIYYNPDKNTIYLVSGINSGDTYFDEVTKKSLFCGYVNTSLPQISKTVFQVEVMGVLVMPFDGEHNTHSGEYFSVMGDSISRYAGFSESGDGWGGNQYPSGDVTDSSQMWWSEVANTTGMKICRINANAGSTCSTANSNRLEASSAERCAALDDGVNTPDHIFVFVGVNDFIYKAPLGTYDGTTALSDDRSNLRNAYASMLSQIQNNYPKAVVHCCTIHQNIYENYKTVSEKLPTVVNHTGVTLREYNQAIREIAAMYGCPVIDLENCGFTLADIDGLVTETTGNTRLHPNAAGHKLIAQAVIKSMK